MECFISDFNRSNTIDFTTAINLFKCLKVHLFILEFAVIVKLVARLFLVELILEYRDLIVESLKFVKEGALAVSGFYFNFLFFLAILSRTFALVTCSILILAHLPLGVLMLCLDLLLSSIMVELPRHEVLVAV